jgi:hypothetical protein
MPAPSIQAFGTAECGFEKDRTAEQVPSASYCRSKRPPDDQESQLTGRQGELDDFTLYLRG